MLSGMHRTSVFKFKTPKSNIKYIKQRMSSGVAALPSIGQSLRPLMKSPARKQEVEVAVDNFIRAARSNVTIQQDIITNKPVKNESLDPLACHDGSWCRNPLCYYNKRTTVVKEMQNICEGVYDNWGPGYTEATYEQAIVNEAYNRKIPLLRQASIDVTNGGCSVHAGRIDLEVDGRYLYELKARDPAMDKDRSQISKYIRAYAQNGKNISRAFLVFFTEKRGVIFEEISCDTHHRSYSVANTKRSCKT